MTAKVPDALLYVADRDASRVVPVYRTLFVGRECAGVPDDQRLILADPAVSRVHLVLEVDAGRVQVTDRSRNGTLLNGAEMPTGTPIVLLDGDTLRVGPTSLMLRTDATLPDLTPVPTSAPAADVTSYAQLPAITAVASSAAAVPDDLVDRLIAAAALFGAVADRMPGSLLMVRWGSTLSAADADRQCARYLDFAKLLAGGLPVEWSLLRA